MVYSTTDIKTHIITTAAASVMADRCDHRNPTILAPGCAASYVGQRQPLGGPAEGGSGRLLVWCHTLASWLSPHGWRPEGGRGELGGSTIHSPSPTYSYIRTTHPPSTHTLCSSIHCWSTLAPYQVEVTTEVPHTVHPSTAPCQHSPPQTSSAKLAEAQTSPWWSRLVSSYSCHSAGGLAMMAWGGRFLVLGAVFTEIRKIPWHATRH